MLVNDDGLDPLLGELYNGHAGDESPHESTKEEFLPPLDVLDQASQTPLDGLLAALDYGEVDLLLVLRLLALTLCRDSGRNQLLLRSLGGDVSGGGVGAGVLGVHDCVVPFSVSEHFVQVGCVIVESSSPMGITGIHSSSMAVAKKARLRTRLETEREARLLILGDRSRDLDIELLVCVPTKVVGTIGVLESDDIPEVTE